MSDLALVNGGAADDDHGDHLIITSADTRFVSRPPLTTKATRQKCP